MAQAYIHETATKVRSVRVVKTGDILTLWQMPTLNRRTAGVKWVMQFNCPGHYVGNKATNVRAKADEMLADMDAAIASGAAIALAAQAEG
jgi:hypothetical protein